MNSGKCQEQMEELGTPWLQASWVLDTVVLPSAATQSAVAWWPLHSEGRPKDRWENTVLWRSLCSWNMGLTQTSYHCPSYVNSIPKVTLRADYLGKQCKMVLRGRVTGPDARGSDLEWLLQPICRPLPAPSCHRPALLLASFLTPALGPPAWPESQERRGQDASGVYSCVTLGRR